jgi:hypothetical protein
MRTLITLIAGIVIGAAAFHAYYIRLAGSDRCIWDHPLDAGGRAVCHSMRSMAGASDPDAEARRQMDQLIENVSR